MPRHAPPRPLRARATSTSRRPASTGGTTTLARRCRGRRRAHAPAEPLPRPAALVPDSTAAAAQPASLHSSNVSWLVDAPPTSLLVAASVNGATLTVAAGPGDVGVGAAGAAESTRCPLVQ